MSVTIKYNVFRQTDLSIEFCFVIWFRVEGKYWHHGKRPLGDRRERKNNHARLGSLAPPRCVLRVLIIQLWKKKSREKKQARSFLPRPVLNVALFSKLPAGSFPGGRGVLPMMAYTGRLCSQAVPGRDFTSWSIRKDRANDKLKKGEETFWFCDLFIYSS